MRCYLASFTSIQKTIRVLQINLVHAIGLSLHFFSLTIPIPIFYIQAIQAFHKPVKVWYAETQVNADIVNRFRAVAFNNMQCEPVPYFKPYMQCSIKGMMYGLKL